MSGGLADKAEKSGPAEPWMQEACNHALEFLSTLAKDDEEHRQARLHHWDRLMLAADDPAKFHTMLFCLVWISHGMRTSANGDTEPGIWTFELETPFGRVPVDQADPALRWVARWLIACMNGDSRAAADLWFSSAGSQEDAERTADLLMGPLLALMTHSVRELLAAGRPFVTPELVRN